VEREAPLDVAGRVSAAAAHAFNNVVAAISLQAELALASAGPEDEKLRRRLQGILGACEDARTLTGDLLAFGGRRALRPSPVDVAAVVERLPGGGAEEVPLMIEVDADALDEALALLTEDGNAAVAARRDGDVVELRIDRLGDEVDDRAFEPFASEDDALGLATVYGFVRQSGGSIDLAATPGGAAVILRFPRAG
jgi:two-component system, cell cycle sensor histidine kinase and response regulator CckA